MEIISYHNNPSFEFWASPYYPSRFKNWLLYCDFLQQAGWEQPDCAFHFQQPNARICHTQCHPRGGCWILWSLSDSRQDVKRPGISNRAQNDAWWYDHLQQHPCAAWKISVYCRRGAQSLPPWHLLGLGCHLLSYESACKKAQYSIFALKHMVILFL